MNNKKISFISCVNDENIYNECLRYINNLNIPKGYSIECIPIRNAKSMTSGYNIAMNKSDSKYKIYIHQDTFIIEKDFLYKILETFKDESIGMIGFAGTEKLNPNGIWWESIHTHNKIYDNAYDSNLIKNKNGYSNDKYIDSEGIDGLIMITQQDIIWREDLFDGWHFYDISQVQEFRFKKYSTVILNTKEPYIIHDCGITWTNTDKEYKKYRKMFLKEYSKKIFPLVSIIIIAYNKIFFKEALESAIGQGYVNKEIIIIDNSTSNNIKKIVKEYLDMDYIKYYKNEKELSISDSLNKGIKLTRSDYICFLREDDIYHKEKLSKMMDYFINYKDLSMVTSHTKCIDIRGNELIDSKETKKRFKSDKVLSGKNIKEHLIYDIGNFLGEISTPIFKKKLLNDFTFGVYRNKKYDFINDLVTWINLSEKGLVIYNPETLSYSRTYEKLSHKKELERINKSIEKVILLKDIIAKDFMKIETNTITNIIREIIFVYSNVKESNVSFIKARELKEVLKALKEFAEVNSKELLKELNITNKKYEDKVLTINNI